MGHVLASLPIAEHTSPHWPDEFLGTSVAIRRFLSTLEGASQHLGSLVVSGETGAGKSLALLALQEHSDRRARWRSLATEELDERFSARLSEEHAERRDREWSVLVIEEIGDLSGAAQRRLLRLLVARDGPTMVATTSRDLADGVVRGTFLRGLLDRFSAHEVRVPSLRERRADLPALFERTLADLSARYRRLVRGLSAEASDLLIAHDWPGNLRELRHELARSLLLTSPGDEIQAAALSPDLRRARGGGSITSSLRQRSRDIERSVLARVLDRHAWNVSAAARELKISRVGLSKKLRVLDLRRPPGRASGRFQAG